MLRNYKHYRNPNEMKGMFSDLWNEQLYPNPNPNANHNPNQNSNPNPNPKCDQKLICICYYKHNRNPHEMKDMLLELWNEELYPNPNPNQNSNPSMF